MKTAEVLESSGFHGFHNVDHFSERHLICEVGFDGCEDAIHKANQVVLRQGCMSVPVKVILRCLVRVGHLTC